MTRPTVLYPGSFDPIHLGHVDVVEQAAELFGDVVVAVMHNPSKPNGMFTIDERVDMARAATAHVGGTRVEPHTGLAVTAAVEVGAAFIVKGLRTPADFEVEQQMALTNHSVSGVRTVYLPCRADFSFVSSRFIREIAQYGGNVRHLVPGVVADRLHGPPGGDHGGSPV